MSELGNIIEVFGAIDEEVVAEPELTPKVAAFLPAYAQGAAGWYQATNAWYAALVAARQAVAPPPAAAGPPPAEAAAGKGEKKPRKKVDKTADAADVIEQPADPRFLAHTLQALADTPSPPDDPWAGRRLLGIALLHRSMAPSGESSDALAPVTTDDLAKALAPLMPPPVPAASRARAAVAAAARAQDERSYALLAGLGDEAKYPNLAAWPTLLKDMSSAGLIHAGVATKQMVPALWEVTRSPTSRGPAVAFATHHRFHGVDPAAIGVILDPQNWAKYNPPWCGMTEDAVGAQGRAFGTPGIGQRFLEVVADDCAPAGSPLYKFTTCLDFLKSPLPDKSGTVLEYRLVPHQGDGAITVDEGTLVVREVGNAVDVITTKRVQFRALRGMTRLDAAMVAQFVWVLGYASLAERFVNVIMAGASAGAKVQALHPSAGGPVATTPPSTPGASLDAVIMETMQDCRSGFSSSFDKISKGQYGVGEYAADVVKVSGHGRRQTAALAGLWTKVLAGAGDPAAPSGSGAPGSK
jgi:hypothetical protein